MLKIIDEAGEEIEAGNPLVTEADGTSGEAIVRRLWLTNTSPQHFFRKIKVLAREVPGVLVEVAASPGRWVASALLPDLYCGDSAEFYVRLTVPPGTAMGTLAGDLFAVSAQRGWV